MIYICIPTHNEQQTVGVVLWKLRQVLTEFPRDYQLLVADDASTDKTPEVLEPYTRVLPLTVIRCERRLGQAASLELLLREAIRRSEYPKRDVVITLQADFSEEPDDVVPMIKKIEAGADVVVGNKVRLTRPTRMHRLARALAGLFARSQQWPEGVGNPFEGYRAYRLYAVKRAVEDRGGRRLIQYDGWAGHAELLRAVLPHARRVEAMDVEDRPDRLQRPRRERPFASAMQVRPMMQGASPAGLVPVDELDRMAATASRSRDRAAASSQRTELARANGQDRSNGRTRQRGSRDGRERSGPPREERPAAARTEPRAAAGGKSRQPDEQRRPKRSRPERPRRNAEVQPTTDAKPPTTEPAATSADEALAAAAMVAPGEGAPKRKRRRKRRGGGAGGNAAAANAAPSSPETEAAVLETVTDSERGEGEPGSTRTGEGKRRRRRGGRGRRRGARPSAEPGASEPTGESAGEPSVALQSQAQVETGNEG